MAMVRRFLVLALAVALSVAARPSFGQTRPAAGEGTWQGPFFFVQLTDTQLGMFAENRSFERETANFEAAIAAANRLRPAFVVITGDLVNRTSDKAQEEEFLRIAGGLDKAIPLYLVAGNHDVLNVPTPESLKHYRDRFGADWYSFDRGGCHFVVVNSSLIQQPKQTADDLARQTEWLKEDLRAAKGKSFAHTILFIHHPPFVKGPAEPDAYHNLPRERRKELLDLLAEHGVRWVFAGHLHHNAVATTQPVEVVATGPVGKPLGKDPSGFRIVKVYRDRIEHEYVPLDRVPERVTLEAPQTTDPAPRPAPER